MSYFNQNPLKVLFPVFICLFALCFSQLSVAASTPTTSELKRLAVTKHDIDAQYLLGYRHEMGKTVKRSYTKAINWYKKAANKNHLDAQYRIGVLYYKRKDYTKARYWLAKRAKGGHADSQYYFAKTFRYGLGTKEQTSLARKWFTKAAKQNHAGAQYELGLQFQKGIGAQKNRNAALKWFNKSAKQGNKKAKTVLAKLKPSKPKISPAKQFMNTNIQLARKGNVKAQYNLGKAYQDGKKTKINLKKSYYWYKKAAKQDHTDAQYRLGLIYLGGNKAAQKDLEQAKFWLTKAADKNHKKSNRKLNELTTIAQNEQREIQLNDIINDATLGDAQQQFDLGMRYLLGYQIEIDKQQAFHWINKAASQNHPLAQYQLANQYMTGSFLNQDIPLSIHLFSEAAKQNVEKAKFALTYFKENGFEMFVKAENGDKEAQYQLALTYLENKLQSEKEKGVKWLQTAALQSHPIALLELGKMYQTGFILKKDDSKAFESLAKAAELNNPDAQYQLSLMYQNGLGTTRDLSLAARWLSRAASQGHLDAQKSLQFSGI